MNNLTTGLITGVIALIGILVTQYVNRKSIKENIHLNEIKSTLDLFKYSIELTEKDDYDSIIKGIFILKGIISSESLKQEHKEIIINIHNYILNKVFTKNN